MPNAYIPVWPASDRSPFLHSVAADVYVLDICARHSSRLHVFSMVSWLVIAVFAW